MYCITGINPPKPAAGLTLVRTLRPDTILYAGTHCRDGRSITASRLYQEAVRLGCTIRRTRPTAGPAPIAQQGLLSNRVEPTALDAMVGLKTEHTELREWIADWPNKGRAVLLVGPPGIGKTTTAHLLAKEAHYAVTEWNASDVRSVGALQALRLGEARIRRELVIMDEVDGLSERGGCAELAALLSRAAMPVICIANTLPPKLSALQKACVVIKFRRPTKSSIATWLGGVAKAVGIQRTKSELEEACEANGNDIRSLLNRMDFERRAPAAAASAATKDPQLDLFAATTRLLGRPSSWTNMEDLVYVDHGMVPLMVQEAYVSASRSIEEAANAADAISGGDLITRRLWSTQDWSLLPHTVATTIIAARSRTGPIPFQIFPRVLGQMSKCTKHRRWMTEIGQARRLSGRAERLEEADSIQKIIARGLQSGTKAAIEQTIVRLDAMGLTRDHVGNMGEILMGAVEIATKTKTTLTREYNKTHTEIRAKKGSTLSVEDEEEEDEDEEHDEQDEQEQTEF